MRRIIILISIIGVLEMDKQSTTSLIVPVIKRNKHRLTVVTRKQILYSKALFEHGDEVLIEHHGEQYSLRLTSNDKLILTK